MKKPEVPNPPGEFSEEQGLRRDDWERAPRPAPWQSRAEAAAGVLAELAAKALPGDRIGSKDDLRIRSGVSVGTFNEAVRIAQSRGVILSRPGVGGGVFAAEQSPMSRLAHSVLAPGAQLPSREDALRIREALVPVLVEDVIANGSPADFAGLTALREDMGRAIELGDGLSFAQAKRRLLLRLIRISPNPLLRGFYELVIDVSEPKEDGPPPLESLPELFELTGKFVDALAARDSARAIKLLANRKTLRAVGKKRKHA